MGAQRVLVAAGDAAIVEESRGPPRVSTRGTAGAAAIARAWAAFRGTRTISVLSLTLAGFSPAGVVAARWPMMPSMTTKPTANEATSAATTASADRTAARTGNSASRPAPTDLNISGSAGGPATGGAIGRDGRAPRSRK